MSTVAAPTLGSPTILPTRATAAWLQTGLHDKTRKLVLDASVVAMSDGSIARNSSGSLFPIVRPQTNHSDFYRYTSAIKISKTIVNCNDTAVSRDRDANALEV